MGIFPQEILDYILGFIPNDENTLKQCGLSSRCLLKTSRKHRFREVTIKGTHRRDAHAAISSFCELTQYQPFATCIHRLKLDMLDLKDEHPSLLLPAPILALTLGDLCRVTAHLPQLERLSIRCADILFDALEDPPPSSSFTLRSLTLQRCCNIYRYIPPLLRLFRPHELELLQNIVDPIDEDEDEDDIILLEEETDDFPLQTLDLHGELDTSSVEALASIISRASVHSIAVAGGILTAGYFFGLDMLIHAATSLNTLRVGTFMSYGMQRTGSAWKSILSSTNLITLEIKVADCPELGEWNPTVDLFRAAPKSIENIHINVLLYPSSTLEIPIDTFRQTFQRLKKLHSVQFIWRDNCFRTGQSIEETIKNINKALHDLKPGLIQHEIE
ncbi:hypothetical protein QCA50_010797 [Cerrena zonata]|uniref:F-box domain-containing protein n=1 Tax=Cerrena zonata TaxID=2478898 RepID=A0AAW0FYF4_9APHY